MSVTCQYTLDRLAGRLVLRDHFGLTQIALLRDLAVGTVFPPKRALKWALLELLH